MASFFYVSYCYLLVTLQTMVSLLKLTRQSRCGSNCNRNFKVFNWLTLVSTNC